MVEQKNGGSHQKEEYNVGVHERLARMETLLERLDKKTDYLFNRLSAHIQEDRVEIGKINHLLTHAQGWIVGFSSIAGFLGLVVLVRQMFSWAGT